MPKASFLTKKYLFLLTISILFILIRLINFSEVLNCTSDTGRFLEDAYKIWQDNKITLLGPFSSLEINSKSIFFGPAIYYFAIPFFVLFGWNQLSFAIFLIAVELISAICVFLILEKKYTKKTAILFLIIFTLNPYTINYSRFYWNPNYLIPASTFLLGFLMLATIHKNKTLWVFLAGILAGVGLQFHLFFITAIIVAFAYLIKEKILTKKILLFFLLGLAIGFSPLILFEVRNSFYHTKLLLFLPFQIITGKSKNTLEIHYFFSLFAFVFLIVATLIKAKSTKKFLFVISLISLAQAAWYLKTLPPKNTGFDMQTGVNCKIYEDVAKIILSQNKESYNIADLLAGDNRALYPRMLTKVAGNEADSYINYPSSKFLYVYTKIAPYKFLTEPTIWEIESTKPIKLNKSWQIKDDIYLHELEKI